MSDYLAHLLAVKFRNYAKNTADSIGDQDGKTPLVNLGGNDEMDAYRHALAGAYWSRYGGEGLSKQLGDDHEDRFQSPTNAAAERNMDKWNNNVGREYAEVDRDGDGLLEYADRLVSTPGRHDGLYWPTQAGEPPSPAGPQLAEASPDKLAARTEATPFHGYYFRVLTTQGPHAPGGARQTPMMTRSGELRLGVGVKEKVRLLVVPTRSSRESDEFTNRSPPMNGRRCVMPMLSDDSFCSCGR